MGHLREVIGTWLITWKSELREDPFSNGSAVLAGEDLPAIRRLRAAG